MQNFKNVKFETYYGHSNFQLLNDHKFQQPQHVTNGPNTLIVESGGHVEDHSPSSGSMWSEGTSSESELPSVQRIVCEGLVSAYQRREDEQTEASVDEGFNEMDCWSEASEVSPDKIPPDALPNYHTHMQQVGVNFLNLPSKERVAVAHEELRNDKLPSDFQSEYSLDYLNVCSKVFAGQGWYNCFSLLTGTKSVAGVFNFAPSRRSVPVFGWPHKKTYRLGLIHDWDVFIDFIPSEDPEVVYLDNPKETPLSDAVLEHIDLLIVCCLHELRRRGCLIPRFWCTSEGTNYTELDDLKLDAKKFNLLMNMIVQHGGPDGVDTLIAENNEAVLNFFQQFQCRIVVQKFGQDNAMAAKNFKEYLASTFIFNEECIESIEFAKAMNLYYTPRINDLDAVFSILLKNEGVRNVCRNASFVTKYPRFFNNQFVNIIEKKCLGP